jgi:hypothetical protein
METMKKAIAIVFAVIGGGIAVLIAIGAILSASGYKAPHADPAVTARATAPATHSPAPVHSARPAVQRTTTAPPAVTPGRRVIRILFTVTGSGYPSITYGTDSDNLSPSGTLGPLGDGNALPWHGSLAYRKGALYYDVSAQLEGGGDIRCAVVLKVTQYYSDGTHISRSKTEARGHASGGYNICDAQVNN